MKIKDLPKNASLADIKVKTPNGVVGFFKSQWNKGVWLSDGKSSRLYPQFVDDIRSCMNWEITEEEVNCHKLTDMKHIDNRKNTW